MSDDKGRSRRWREVHRLVARIEPRVIEIFQRNGISPEDSVPILEEVVNLLLYRWGEVASPEAWVMEMLEHKAWRSRGPNALEPRKPESNGR